MPKTLTAVVNPGGNGNPFYAVSFTNGALLPEKAGSCEVNVYKDRTNEKNFKMVVSTSDMDYVGDFTSDPDEGKFLGVETDSGEMQIVPLKHVRLRPAISVAQEKAAEGPSQTLTRQEQHEALVEKFGSAREKLNMERKRKHGIDNDMIYDAMDTSGVQDISVSSLESPAKQKDEGVLPPHDTETTDPDHAYPLDGYLPAGIREDLLGFIDELAGAEQENVQEWRTSKRFPLFVLDQLEKMPLSEEQRKESAVLIKYIAILLKFYKMKAQQLKVKDPFAEYGSEYSMPASCLTHIFKTYTTGSNKSRSTPARLKDKVLVTILLLALRLERNTLQCDTIMADTAVGMKKLVDICRSMGLKVKKDSSKDIPAIVVTLTAPLKFTKSRSGTPRPRKR